MIAASEAKVQLERSPVAHPFASLDKRRALEFTFAADLSMSNEAFDDEIVEGVLCRSSMAAIFGDSNSGKTFAAIALAASVSQGSDWFGRRCDCGLVVYLASEAAGSVELRLKAYQRHYNVRLPNVVIVQSPINLFDTNADVAAVLVVVAEAERRTGMKVTLVIGDTLARIAAGANENSGDDMGVVISNADRIREVTCAAFLWIHHCGKDASRGMRGWSGLRAFIDSEFEITGDEASANRCLEVTKQRDLGSKGQRIGFQLVEIVMGYNKWGTARSTCVAVPADAPAKHSRGKRHSEIAPHIIAVLDANPGGCSRSHLVGALEGKAARQSVYREVANLLKSGKLIQRAGLVQQAARSSE